MSLVYFLRGLPASGKTTVAQQIATMLPETYIVSKDKLRTMLCNDRPYGQCDLYLTEDARNEILRVLLRRGKDVVLDETFIEVEDINGAQALVGDQHKLALYDLTWVSFDVCYQRDYERGQRIGFDALYDAKCRLDQNSKRIPHDLLRPFDYVLTPQGGYRELQPFADRHEGIPAS